MKKNPQKKTKKEVKFVEIWLAEYDPNQFKTTTCVLKIREDGKGEVTTNKKALGKALDIIQKSPLAIEMQLRKFFELADKE